MIFTIIKNCEPPVYASRTPAAPHFENHGSTVSIFTPLARLDAHRHYFRAANSKFMSHAHY